MKIEQETSEDKQLKSIFHWCNLNGIVHDPGDMKKMQEAGIFYALDKPIKLGKSD